MKKISTASFIIAAIFSSAVSANHHSGGCAEKYKQYHHKPYSNSYIHHGAMPIYKHPHYQKMPRYYKPSRGYHNPYRMNKHNSMSYDRQHSGVQVYKSRSEDKISCRFCFPCTSLISSKYFTRYSNSKKFSEEGIDRELSPN